MIDGIKDFEFALGRKLNGAQPDGPTLGAALAGAGGVLAPRSRSITARWPCGTGVGEVGESRARAHDPPAPLARARAGRGRVAATTFATRAGAQWRRFVAEPNASYDGRFTFVRLSYTVYGHSGWEFDYPAMERNFMTILNDLTTVHPHVSESNIHAMDDPELRSLPDRVSPEPGWWHPTEDQAKGLARGSRRAASSSSTIFYWPAQWNNFERSMKHRPPGTRRSSRST